MKSRNVIISLLIVLIILAFVFIKINYWEPKKKLSFNRNPSRIEYSNLALCQMDCYNITANDITVIIKTGFLIKEKSNLKKKTFALFAIDGQSNNKGSIQIMVEQSGKVAKIKECLRMRDHFVCPCYDIHNNSISFFKRTN